MAKKCRVCGSRKWRKDAVTGSVVCDEGHVLQGVRSENLVAEMTGHALMKRRLTKGPRVNKRQMEGRGDKNFLHGEDAEWLRLQALQLMLRHQVRALKNLWELPSEIELITRDLWTYQLMVSDLPDRPRSRSVSPPPPLVLGTYGSDTEGSDNEMPIKSEDEKEDIDPDLIAELEEDSDADPPVKEELDLYRDIEDGEATTSWKRRRAPNAYDTLVCLMLSLWILRIPFTHVELESLINTNHIPYVAFGKSTLVPLEMRSRMNLHVRKALQPHRSPDPSFLFESTRRFARVLTRHFGQSIPEMNTTPLAWHVVSQLGGTSITTTQVLNFLRLVDANMSLNDAHVNQITQRRRNSAGADERTYDKTSRYSDIAMPELSIAAGWVVVMKLAYGLDGQERLPLLKIDPLIDLIPGDEWVAELQKYAESGVLKGSKVEMEKQRFDVMDGDDIDRFLDQCEQVLLENRDHGNGGGPFPIPRPSLSQLEREPNPPPSTQWEAFYTKAWTNPVTQAAAPKMSTPTRSLPLMPGERLKSYDTDDITGSLPPQLEAVLQAAADVIGVDASEVAEVVERFERRMEAARPRRVQSNSSPAMNRVRGGIRESHSFG